MDDSLYFSEQHLATREMVRQFARDEVAPVAAKHDADATFPWENIRKMGELGLLGVPWPEELGGAGLDLISYMIVIHELAKVDASHGLTISAHTTLGTSPIVRFGTRRAEASATFRSSRRARCMGGFGLTEPEAGSDAGGTRTTAVRRGNCYVLNGVKRFITHGGVGEIFVVTAVTDPSQGTKGISSFILTKPTNDLDEARRRSASATSRRSSPMPGFRAGKKEDKLGWRASDTCELIMEDVEVPAENLLGEEGAGLRELHADARQRPHRHRRAVARHRRGRVRAGAAVHDAFASSSASRSRSSRASQFQLVRHGDGDRGGEAPDVPRRVARAARQAVHARKRRWRSSSARSSPCAPRSRRCSSTAATATPRTIRSSAIMRDAKICEIGEGTSEIQRIVIARQLLKELAD